MVDGRWVWGWNDCDSGCSLQLKITGLSRQILIEWLPPQTRGLHRFVRP
jgi:hypothetical protein